jgi:membrane-associated phospholipid phosphatase
VGASRVYLRVHYPSDVVAGQVLGAAGAVLAVSIMY